MRRRPPRPIRADIALQADLAHSPVREIKRIRQLANVDATAANSSRSPMDTVPGHNLSFVVGSHGQSRAEGIALGSVATHLLHEAPCSVLIARPTEERQRWLERRNGEPVFGPESPIATKAECDAVGGNFHPSLFGWMVHANVMEPGAAGVWGDDHAGHDMHDGMKMDGAKVGM